MRFIKIWFILRYFLHSNIAVCMFAYIETIVHILPALLPQHFFVEPQEATAFCSVPEQFLAALLLLCCSSSLAAQDDLYPLLWLLLRH